MQNRCIYIKSFLFNALKNFLNIKIDINEINYLGYTFVKEIIYNDK